MRYTPRKTWSRNIFWFLIVPGLFIKQELQLEPRQKYLKKVKKTKQIRGEV